MVIDLRRLLYVSAYQAYLGTLHGCSAPITGAAHKGLSKPTAGHLVMEVTTIYMADRDDWRFGRLLRVVEEPAYTREKWREGGGKDDEPIPTERVWYIELPDGTEYRWVNASFIRVLERPFSCMDDWECTQT